MYCIVGRERLTIRVYMIHSALYSIVAVQTRNRYKELSKYDNGDCVIPGLAWLGQSFDVMGSMEPWFGYSQSVFHVPW
jgi:hypothetical protein